MSTPIQQQQEAIEKLKLMIAKGASREHIIGTVEATLQIFKSTLDVLIEEKAKSLGALGGMVPKIAGPVVSAAFTSVQLLIVQSLE